VCVPLNANELVLPAPFQEESGASRAHALSPAIRNFIIPTSEVVIMSSSHSSGRLLRMFMYKFLTRKLEFMIILKAREGSVSESVGIDPSIRINLFENPSLKSPSFGSNLPQTYKTTDFFFFWDISFEKETPMTQMAGVYGDSYVHWHIPKHNTCNAFLAQTLYNSRCYSEDTEMADSVQIITGCGRGFNLQ